MSEKPWPPKQWWRSPRAVAELGRHLLLIEHVFDDTPGYDDARVGRRGLPDISGQARGLLLFFDDCAMGRHGEWDAAFERMVQSWPETSSPPH